MPLRRLTISEPCPISPSLGADWVLQRRLVSSRLPGTFNNRSRRSATGHFIVASFRPRQRHRWIAYSAYIDMGAPRDLTAIQLERLNLLTRDVPEIDRVVRVEEDGSCKLSLPMRSNDVVLVTFGKVKK